jgi:hypothetical protein
MGKNESTVALSQLIRTYLFTKDLENQGQSVFSYQVSFATRWRKRWAPAAPSAGDPIPPDQKGDDGVVGKIGRRRNVSDDDVPKSHVMPQNYHDDDTNDQQDGQITIIVCGTRSSPSGIVVGLLLPCSWWSVETSRAAITERPGLCCLFISCWYYNAEIVRVDQRRHVTIVVMRRTIFEKVL